MSEKISALPNLSKSDVSVIDLIPVVAGGENYFAYSRDLFGGMPKSFATKVVAASNTPDAISRADYVCDGTADEVEVQLAIDALPAGGGKVEMLEGDFNFAAPAILATGTSVVGAGIGRTVINGNFSGTGTRGVFDTSSEADTDDIAVAELTINLTNAPNLTGGIYFRRGTGLWANRVKVVDTSSAAGVIITFGVRLGVFGNGSMLVDDVVISACILDGKSDGGRDFAPLGLFWCQNVRVTDTRCKGRDLGVAIDAAKSFSLNIQGADNVVISNSIVELGHHNGIFFQDTVASGYQSTNIIIADSLIVDNGDDGIDPNNTAGLTIANNIFRDNEGLDISCEDSCDKVTVTGNTFINGRVKFQDSKNLAFVGNMLYGVHDAVFLIIVDGVDGLVIASNMLGNGDTAVSIDDSVRVLVSNNLVRMAKSNGAFVRVNDSSFCTIKGNQVSNRTDFTGAVLKLRLLLESGASDNNRYEDNDDRQVSGTSTVTIVGANTIARRNEFYVTENGGTSGAIATGGTIAHGLAAAPAIVQVNAAEAGPTDITISVDATDITVNFGGGGNKTFFWSARVDP